MLSIRRQRDFGRIIRVGLELSLLVLGGALLAKLAWLFITPSFSVTVSDGISTPKFGNIAGESSNGPSDTTLLIEKNFFKSIGSTQTSAEIPETRLNLTLKGVRSGGAGTVAVAIIRTPDNKDKSYAVGDEIVSGVKLDGVLKDRVILDKNGAREVLVMAGASTILTRATKTETSSAAVAPTPAVQDVIDLPNTIISAIRLDATNIGDGIVVLARNPEQNDLSKYGFVSGDRLVSINGLPASELKAQNFFAAFMSGEIFTIELDRDGEILTQRMRRSKEN